LVLEVMMTCTKLIFLSAIRAIGTYRSSRLGNQHANLRFQYNPK
jgi:hypothetical protein